jgi:hypothetical protein
LAKENQVRAIAQAVIQRVIAENEAAGRPGDSGLDMAYPFGVRSGLPWQLWCEETHRVFSVRSTAA